jgi:hypothetical protein
MAQGKASARKLATSSEWTLLETSFPPLLKDITPGRLRQKITRARKLQDKYRDLARQQGGEARGKRPTKSTRAAAGNANTLAKQELFSEALARFETQLAKCEARAATVEARKQSAARKTAKARKSVSTSARARKVTAQRQATNDGIAAQQAEASTALARKAVSKSARGSRKAAVLSRTSSIKQQAHAGARGRRRQASRDAR